MKNLKAALFSMALIGMPLAAQADDFKLSSSNIAEGQQLSAAHVFQGFGCKGDNTSPDLSWANAPEGTKSFAVTVYDPDAPTGSGWWHWFAFDIPANVNSLPTAATTNAGVPVDAIELKNDYGAVGFGGACPPPGEVHRYKFTVHALSVEKLGIDGSVSNALAGFMVNANSIASSTITAVYNR